jgi:hypothetical protein
VYEIDGFARVIPRQKWITGSEVTDQAIQLSERTGVRLVFTLLSSPWVHEAACWACVNLPEEVAVVMGERRRFGELPVLEWGRVREC